MMGREDPDREGSVSSFDLRILITWTRKKMLRVMTTITGTERNKLDDLHSSTCKLLLCHKDTAQGKGKCPLLGSKAHEI